MVAVVEQTASGAELHKRLAVQQGPHVKTVLHRQIDATDCHDAGGRAGT